MQAVLPQREKMRSVIVVSEGAVEKERRVCLTCTYLPE